MRIIPVLFLLVFAACSSVDRVYMKPGFLENELRTVKHIAVAVDPASVGAGDQDARNKILQFRSREHLINHSEYITHRPREAQSLLDMCKANPKLNGVLVQKLSRAEKIGGSIRLAMISGLYECKTGVLLWEARASSKYTMNDSDFATLVAGDVKRFGDAARNYSAPFYRMIRDLYESLPMPELSAEEKMEKIEADSE
jgi:probable lipoprotein (TIGR04455 family)